jgi:RimJ/RimL family protein N-acetyltransferase
MRAAYPRRVKSAIRLEPFAESHLDAVAELVADPAIHRFTGVPVPVPPDFPRAWLQRYEDGRAAGTAEAFAIVDAEAGAFLGLALAVRIDRPALTAELGYALAPGARGRGIATEALRRLTEWAFAELGALRLELRILAENDGSKAVAARCGYVREGVLRSAHFKQGLRADTELWSRLPTDP